MCLKLTNLTYKFICFLPVFINTGWITKFKDRLEMLTKGTRRLFTNKQVIMRNTYWIHVGYQRYMFIYKLLGSDHYYEVTKSISSIVDNICSIWHVLTFLLPSTSSNCLITMAMLGLFSLNTFSGIWYLIWAFQTPKVAVE